MMTNLPVTSDAAPENLEQSPVVPRTMKAGFWVCIVIAIAVVIRRLVALQQPASTGRPPELARLDAFFLSHAGLTYVHILTALAFVCLLPFLFWSRTRHSSVLKTIFFPLGTVVGLTAYGMNLQTVGGWVERTAVLFFDTFFLFSMAQSYRAWRAGSATKERRWTLRAVAILLGIATTRPVMGVFFATTTMTHWTPQQFFGFAFWIGFSINTLTMELWLRKATSNAIEV